MMAKPIKETPILRGKDAKIFLKATTENEHKSISSLERAKMDENYDKLKSISGF